MSEPKIDEKKLKEYCDKYDEIGLSTESCNRTNAEKALKDLYAYFKKPEPVFHWASSPAEGIRMAAKLNTGKDVPTQEEIRAQASYASYGSFEAYWLVYYSYILNEIKKETDPLLDILDRIIKDTGVYWCFEDCVVVSEKPTEIHLKGDKLHNPDGLAIKYKDGTGIYCVEGTQYKSMMDAVAASLTKSKE